MFKIETVFAAADSLTPEFAAKLSDCSARFKADVYLACGDKQLSLDSLICILALDLHRGVAVIIVADGEDEVVAADAIKEILEGKR